MHRRLWLLVGAAAAVLLLAASATATTKTAGTARAADATPAAAPFAQSWANVPRTPAARKAKSTLVFGMEQDVDGFNSNLSCCNEFWAQVTGDGPVVRGAYVITDKAAYKPDLASKIVATKKTLTYTIRPNAVWNWGGKKVPVTYQDFVYTWKAFTNPKNDVVSRDGYDQITGYTHKGDKQITFKWKKPYADYRDLFSIVYPSQALAGMNFNKIWANCVCGNDGQPVADGPFMLTNYTKGQGLTLKANPFWYGKKPHLDEVDFKLITDTNSEIQAMRGGEVDAINPSPQTALTSLESQKGLVYSSVPGLYQEHIDLQFGKKGAPLLRQSWMRQAIMMGIDRKAIINALFGKVAPGLKPLDNIVFYQSDKEHYRPDFAQWNFNTGKAIALLKKNGCTGGPDKATDGNTNYWTCNGQPAKFAYTTTAGNQRRETTEAVVKAQLGAIGIQITDNIVPANVAFGPTVLSASNYDMFEFAWVTSPDPAAFVPIWSCGGESNYLKYCNKAASKLMKASNSELNTTKRGQEFIKADALMAKDVPTIPLYAQPSILVYKKAISGMKNNPSTSGFSWNIEDWKWKS